MTESVYSMVLFYFQGSSNGKEKVGKKRYQEVVGRYKSFLSKYSIEVKELLATKRIVLIKAFIIHSSIY